MVWVALGTPLALGSEEELGEFVTFPSCGVSLRQPAGFSAGERFAGFGAEEHMASIVVVCVQGPFSAVTGGFTAEALSARGWTLRRLEDLRVADRPALWVDFEQNHGGTVFSKWTLAFGDEAKTTVLTASVPKSLAGEFSSRMQASLRSAKVVPAVAAPGLGDELPFTLEPSGRLERAPALSHAIVYTLGGVIPLRSPGDPRFIVAPSNSERELGDRRQFAEKRLQATADTEELVVKSTTPVVIAGLEGLETLAEARDTKSKTPLVLYQVVLFEGRAYVLMQGLVEAAQSESFLPEFKALSRSFRKRE